MKSNFQSVPKTLLTVLNNECKAFFKTRSDVLHRLGWFLHMQKHIQTEQILFLQLYNELRTSERGDPIMLFDI